MVRMSSLVWSCVVGSLLTTMGGPVAAQEPASTTGQAAGAEATDDAFGQWAAKAAKVLDQTMAVPEKAIPSRLLERAKCVAVFPSVVKAGFIVGARYGDGLVSCRQEESGDWGPPIFLNVVGGSFGLQIGAQAADVILLVMNQKGLEGLLKTTVSLGGEVRVAAGPVGRNTAVGTDVLLRSAMISYARTKGLFAGATLEGATVRRNRSANVALYGEDIKPGDILLGSKPVPPNVKVFLDALKRHAPVQAP